MAERQLTPQEIVASVARLEAEAEKFKAEAQHAIAEARRFDHEALMVETEAERNATKRRLELATDAYHRVFRFNGPVTEMNVNTAISTLGAWSRLYPGQDLEIDFTSPGGDITQGLALFDFLQVLRHRGHKVITGVLGEAASMAAVLVQAGDHRWMGPESWYLIHRAAFQSAGKTAEQRDMVEQIERIEERFIGILTSRSSLEVSDVKGKWERKDWWLNATECLELGLIDEVRGPLAPVEKASRARRKKA
jgi:ATP-dependent Clp endopeptidase proteolytic subunit ClpP